MIMRIKVSQPLFLYAGFKHCLADLTVSFAYRHYAVTLTIAGGEIEKATWAKPTSQCQWYRKATHLVVTIAETERSLHRIAELIISAQHETLLKLLEGVTLQVLRVIRNVGIVPELPESLPREESLDEELRAWGPEVSEDNVAWKAVLPPDTSGTFRFVLGIFGPRKEGFSPNAELDAMYWDHIREVLEDNLDIPPEDEFLTNTTGHLRSRNYRLAVVDAVIGLEIVLDRYLKAYLDISIGLPKKRITNFFGHDFGLTARLSEILELTIHKSYLKDINMDHVLKVVGWRNNIVHRKGRLPPDIPTDTVKEGISAVLKLARMLAELHINTLAQPHRNKIRDVVMTKWSERIYLPRIWIKPWHRVTAEIEFFGERLSREEMIRIADEFATHLKVRDPRFDPSAHLGVTYYHGFPSEYFGEYRFGRVLLKGEPLFELLPPTTTESDTHRTDGSAAARIDLPTPES